MTKVLFVGYLGRGQTSGMRAAALARLGYNVATVEAGGLWRGVSYLTRQIEQLSASGARIDRLNAAVLEAAARHKPNMVWAEKQEYLRATRSSGFAQRAPSSRTTIRTRISRCRGSKLVSRTSA